MLLIQGVSLQITILINGIYICTNVCLHFKMMLYIVCVSIMNRNIKDNFEHFQKKRKEICINRTDQEFDIINQNKFPWIGFYGPHNKLISLSCLQGWAVSKYKHYVQGLMLMFWSCNGEPSFQVK